MPRKGTAVAVPPPAHWTSVRSTAAMPFHPRSSNKRPGGPEVPLSEGLSLSSAPSLRFRLRSRVNGRANALQAFARGILLLPLFPSPCHCISPDAPCAPLITNVIVASALPRSIWQTRFKDEWPRLFTHSALTVYGHYI